MENQKYKNQPKIVDNISVAGLPEKRQFVVGKNQEKVVLQGSFKKKNFFKTGFIIFILLIIICVGTLVYFMNKNSQQVFIYEQQKQVAIEKAKTAENAFVSDVSASLDDMFKNIKYSSPSPESENFQMKEFFFGNKTTIEKEVKDDPFEIYDVQVEKINLKDLNQAKLFISWKTNKLAISQVAYANIGMKPNILTEDGVGFSHALIIGKFDFNNNYTYVITARDRLGNIAVFNSIDKYSPKKIKQVQEKLQSQISIIMESVEQSIIKLQKEFKKIVGLAKAMN